MFNAQSINDLTGKKFCTGFRLVRWSIQGSESGAMVLSTATVLFRSGVSLKRFRFPSCLLRGKQVNPDVLW